MLAPGEPIPAKAALEWGLANRVLPLERLQAEALTLPNALPDSSPSA